MFRYGLVGNLATYGGIAAIFGYVGINLINLAYELNNIIELSPKLSEEVFCELNIACHRGSRSKKITKYINGCKNRNEEGSC
jgi:hypothetical protein